MGMGKTQPTTGDIYGKHLGYLWGDLGDLWEWFDFAGKTYKAAGFYPKYWGVL